MRRHTYPIDVIPYGAAHQHLMEICFLNVGLETQVRKDCHYPDRSPYKVVESIIERDN